MDFFDACARVRQTTTGFAQKEQTYAESIHVLFSCAGTRDGFSLKIPILAMMRDNALSPAETDVRRKETILGSVAKWRRERLGRKAVRRLYPILIRRYGKADRYTAGQIERALQISGLKRRYRPYAYAVFTTPTEIPKLTPDLKEKVLPLTSHDGLAMALQSYALLYLQGTNQAADDGGNNWYSGSMSDGGVGDGGGNGGGDG